MNAAKTETSQRSQRRLSARLALGGLSAATLLLTACGGGGSDSTSGGTSPTPATLTGVFVDAAVQGLSYKASPSGKAGSTNAGGQFNYVAGATVSFTLGQVALGSAKAQGTLTPKTLADAVLSLPGGVSAADVSANIALFLQTFDSDSEPDNGITIDTSVAQKAASSINFAQPAADFPTDATLATLAANAGVSVVTPAAAQAHQVRSVTAQLAGTWVRHTAGGDTAATFSIFTDGTYVFAERSQGCDGVQWGHLAINANTGTFREDASYVDAGGCGPHGAGDIGYTLNDDGTLTSKPSASERYTFVRAAGTGVVGSWLLNQPLAAGKPVGGPYIQTYFSDGKYLIADVLNGQGDVTDPEDQATPGIEFGNWSVDAKGALTASKAVDTNGLGNSFVSGSTLQVDADGQLVLVESSGDTTRYSRLPLSSSLTVADLAGSWYAADPQTPGADPELAELTVMSFFDDGRFVAGSQSADPNCDAQYGDANPEQSADGPLDPDGLGSEYGQYLLETGLGRLYAPSVSIDSDGACGFFNATHIHDPSHSESAYLKKIDANTLQFTYYERQDGATGEAADDSYQPGIFLLKRMQSNANSLVGSWADYNEDGSLDGTENFFPNGALFSVDADQKGGIERERWYVTTVNNIQTLTVVNGPNDPNNPYFIDTIGPDVGHNTATQNYTLSFSSDGLKVTAVNVNDANDTWRLTKISAP